MPSLQCEVDMHHACEGCRCPCHFPAKISEQSRKNPERKRGAPEQIPGDIRARILELHASGRAYTWIAAQLNRERVPTVRGKRWYAATIRTVVLSTAALSHGDSRETDTETQTADGAIQPAESL